MGYQNTVSSLIVIKQEVQDHKSGQIKSKKNTHTVKLYSSGFAYVIGFMVHLLQIYISS
jgi:hypothetical protein